MLILDVSSTNHHQRINHIDIRQCFIPLFIAFISCRHNNLNARSHNRIVISAHKYLIRRSFLPSFLPFSLPQVAQPPCSWHSGLRSMEPHLRYVLFLVKGEDLNQRVLSQGRWLIVAWSRHVFERAACHIYLNASLAIHTQKHILSA